MEQPGHAAERQGIGTGSPDGATPLRIPASVVSRTLDLGETGIRSIAYNTRSQSVSVLEDDSASVWGLLYENDGDATAALAYIAQAGTFPGDPAAGARETLAGFAEELTSLGLLEPRSDEAGAPVSGSTASASRPDEIAPEGERTEIAFAGLMADHHVLYSLVLELTYRCNESCVHCYCPSDRILPELTLPRSSICSTSSRRSAGSRSS